MSALRTGGGWRSTRKAPGGWWALPWGRCDRATGHGHPEGGQPRSQQLGGSGRQREASLGLQQRVTWG